MCIHIVDFIYLFIYLLLDVNNDLLKEIGMKPILKQDKEDKSGELSEAAKPIKRAWRLLRNPFNLSQRSDSTGSFDRIDPLRGIVPDRLEESKAEVTEEKEVKEEEEEEKEFF